MPPKKNPAPKSSAASSERTTRVRASSRVAVKEAAKPVEKPAKKEKPVKKKTDVMEKPTKKEKLAKEVAKPRKMAASAKSTSTKSSSTTATKKRKAEEEEEKPREIKRSRVAKPRQPRAKPSKVVINEAPKAKLNVFVCGEGSSGELGLGTAKNVIDVKRPRLNKLLSAEEVGIVQVAVGGMHCVALTHDNKIFTWGVNDQGALGRETNWDGGYKDMDDNSDSDSDDDDSGLNPLESNPTPIPEAAFPKGTVFVKVAAADSSSFALTDDGLVYGWGTFRVSERTKPTR
jgi:regulator of chromosome condensation